MAVEDQLTRIEQLETKLLTSASKDTIRVHQEQVASLRLQRGRLLLEGGDVVGGLSALLHSLAYTPESLLTRLSIDPRNARLSTTTHILIPLLATHELSFAHPLKSAAAEDNSPCLTPALTANTNSDALAPSDPVPPFHPLHLTDNVRAPIEDLKPLAALNRVLRLVCGVSPSENDVVEPVLLDSEIWRLVDVESAVQSEGLDLHWMVILGTWHLYTGQIRIWLRKIFNRMQDQPRAVQTSTPIKQNQFLTSTPSKTATPLKTSSRRLTPTIIDMETFLLALIARNYIDCILHGAKNIQEVLWHSVLGKVWKPSEKMLSFWQALLIGYSDLTVDSGNVVPMNAVELTRYLRDIRGLNTEEQPVPKEVRGLVAHVGTMYARLALLGVEDCRSVATNILDSVLINTQTLLSNTGEFYQDLAHGFKLKQEGWDMPLIDLCRTYKSQLQPLTLPPSSSPRRSTSPMRQNQQVDTATTPTRQNPFSPRSRTPSPTRAYTPHKQLFSPAKKATTPTPITPASKWRNPAKSPASAEKKTPASALYPSTDAPEFKWEINSTPTKVPVPKTTSEIELEPPLRELAESLQAELDAQAPLQESDSSGKPTAVDAKQQSMFVGKNGRVLEALRIRKTVWSGSVGFGLLNVPTPSKDQFRGLVGVDMDAGWNDFDEGLSLDKSVEVEGEDEGLDLGSLRKERLNKAFRNGKRFV